MESSDNIFLATLERIKNKATGLNTQKTFNTFQLSKDIPNSQGETKRNVGTAFVREGIEYFTLTLSMFLGARFYLIPKRNEYGKFLLFTREKNESPNPKTKYRWNIIGNGELSDTEKFISIRFDLLESEIFLNLESASDPNLANHALHDKAA